MKNKQKLILCLLIVTVFLIPLMGNSVLSEGRSSGTAIYDFIAYDEGEAWEINPEYMVDCNISNYASTNISGDVEYLIRNSYDGIPPGRTITKVELRAYGKYSGSVSDIILRPVFYGIWDGANHYFTPGTTGDWSEWFDITDDPNPGPTWDWDGILNLDCDVEMGPCAGQYQSWVYCSKVQIRVTYTD